MRIFLDTSDPAIIDEYQHMIDGVTTNPSLLSKAKTPIKESIQQMCQLVPETVSVEAIAEEYDDMIAEGERILDYADNIALKLPITKDGLKACAYFSKQGHMVNMTLCFSVSQALLAAKHGAAYVSPFIGRLDDQGADGIQLIKDITQGFNFYGIETNVLAASIRSIKHIEQCFIAGVDIITLPPKLLEEMLKHPLTDAGIEKFKLDWQNSSYKH